ncbi:cache domain-containing sensor histidine kinase [Paenibacillus humicola]|uniref:cache domain-containing sensor histidine kinase n=1 Tax=Paenibacillus humicola TaxID=3110540 RepID=UPI00237AF91D|nr:sensor histidine kinase [Paenibacillus humicola]
MRAWKHYMLKTKMFIAFSAVSLFLVLLTCLIFYYKSVSDIRSQTFSLSDTITRQFSRTLELYIQDTEKLSVSVFGDPVIQQGLLDHYRSRDDTEQNEIELSINSRLFTYLQPRPQLQSLYVFTLDNNVYYISKANGPKVSYSLSSEPWYKGAGTMGGSKFLLLPVTEEDTGDGHKANVISFVRNINRIPYRDVIAYMKININVNVIRDMLVHADSNEVEQHMRVFIETGDGDIVYDNKDVLTGSSGTGPEPSIFRKNSRSGDLIWQGKRYIYTFAKSDYTKWNTIILIPDDVLLSQQKSLRYILMLVGLLAMALIAVVSYLLSHQITLPLRYLMKKMIRVEHGDLSQRVTVRSSDEIGRLTRIYNNMLDSISRLIREAYESKLAEKNAQLAALQAQINPHFLYNTLNIMKSISRVRGIEEVAEMSEALAELFKYSMHQLHQPVPLQAELDHIANYMKIQQHRFGSRFEYRCDVPEELMRVPVLKLTIQPLVENAVAHGFAKMKADGIVALSARREGGRLTIEVADNGQGMTDDRLFTLRRDLQSSRSSPEDDEAHGIGLRNIGQRIRLFYGEECGIAIESGPGRGTSVRLTIPCLTAEHEHGEDTA